VHKYLKGKARANYGRQTLQKLVLQFPNYGHTVAKTAGDHIAEFATGYISCLPDTHNGVLKSNAKVKLLDRSVFPSPTIRLGLDPTLQDPQVAGVPAAVYAPCEQDFQLHGTQCTFLLPTKMHPYVKIPCPACASSSGSGGAGDAPLLAPDGYCHTTKRSTDFTTSAVTTVVQSQMLKCRKCNGKLRHCILIHACTHCWVLLQACFDALHA
jgi:hypothetical protein